MAFATVITGVLYPALVTLTAQVAFPDQANGSLLREHDVIVGSHLIGQGFSGPTWFWSRPSAVGWNAASSGGANLAPVTEPQKKVWADQAASVRASVWTTGIGEQIPADLVTASGSGLDPHLSPAALLIQVPRIASARGITSDKLRELIGAHTEPPQCGVLGAERVNVLELNLALLRLAGGR